MGLYSKSVVGLEIDSFEIRAVEAEWGVKKPVLKSFSRISLPEGAVKEGRIADQAAVKACIEKLWLENKIKSKNVFLGVSNQDVIIRFALFPKVPKDKLKNLVRFQAQEYIPVPLNEMELDFMVTGEIANEEGTFLKVLLVAAKTSMINGYVDTLLASKLRVKDIDSSLLALGRLVPTGDRGGTVAMAALTADMLDVLIMDKGLPVMARSVAFAQPTAAVMKKSSDMLLVGAGMPGREAPDDVQMAYDSILGEIKSSISYYHMNNDTHIKCIYAAGPGARINELAASMKLNLDIPVNIIADISGYAEDKGKNKMYEAADYAVCLSLALRGLEE